MLVTNLPADNHAILGPSVAVHGSAGLRVFGFQRAGSVSTFTVLLTDPRVDVESVRRVSVPPAIDAAAIAALIGARTGSFAGIVESERSLVIFNDRLGRTDLFLWQSRGAFAISDRLRLILEVVGGERRLVDVAGVTDYAVLGFCTGERTLFQDIRRLGPASLISIDAKAVRTSRYWQYRFGAGPHSFEDAVGHFEMALNGVARGVRERDSPILLALSGGMDSRVVGAALHLAGVPFHAYFFGESDSSAGRVAARVAQALGTDLTYPNEHRALSKFFPRLATYSPMANLEWCKYATGREGLVGHRTVATGKLGDHLLGRWPMDLLRPNISDDEVVSLLFATFALEPTDDVTADGIRSRMSHVVHLLPGSPIERYLAFQLFQIDSTLYPAPLFHDFGDHPHFSPFENLELFDTCLSIRPRWRFGRRIHAAYLQRKMPQLTEVAIPRDNGTNDHKPLERWLYANEAFADDALAVLRNATDLPGRGGTLGELMLQTREIVSGNLGRPAIHAYFRRLTIASCLSIAGLSAE